MGIVNVTPDSFSGDGLLSASEQPDLAHLDATLDNWRDAGCTLIDIGGESTRPGASPVAWEEECARILPIVRHCAQHHSDFTIAIDTRKAGVAAQALDAGAHWINDVSALQDDPGMAPLLSDAKCPVVLMHNRARWLAVESVEGVGASYTAPDAPDEPEAFLTTLLAEMKAITQQAITAGLQPANIILDPGFGFGKTVEHNLAMLQNLPAIFALGHRVLIGTSRKSFIGRILDRSDTERLAGTLATLTPVAALGERAKDSIVRVHDVPETRDMLTMLAALHA